MLLQVLHKVSKDGEEDMEKVYRCRVRVSMETRCGLLYHSRSFLKEGKNSCIESTSCLGALVHQYSSDVWGCDEVMYVGM